MGCWPEVLAWKVKVRLKKDQGSLMVGLLGIMYAGLTEVLAGVGQPPFKSSYSAHKTGPCLVHYFSHLATA